MVLHVVDVHLPNYSEITKIQSNSIDDTIKHTRYQVHCNDCLLGTNSRVQDYRMMLCYALSDSCNGYDDGGVFETGTALLYDPSPFCGWPP